ncbi:MAG: 4Fe-4S dicluster domain-containing protein [Planctomycetes bacterium]|jgi:MauM/NapG family ferredoxin protein|nr:4Fe-4S dicluster domain-containing protein [Planctomycetota bacterium]MCL4730254.1 4Fe-4S dicluster domain-containing protein [Planctomycetota bacterium]
MTSGPVDRTKRESLRQFAGEAAKYATRMVPGARIVQNFDADLFRKLYEEGKSPVPARGDFEDMHGRRFFRPPGAIHEREFLDACSRCGKCVEACPEKVLHLAAENEGPPKGTPVLRPNHGACTLCGDCMTACPTGALKPTPVGEIRIGIAVIQPDSCLGYHNKSCRACHDACPLEPNAIDFEATVPKVDSRVCTGCGLCVHACPTRPPSVLVLPRPARPPRGTG